MQLCADNSICASSVKCLSVHLDRFNFPTSGAADSPVKLPPLISVPAQPTISWKLVESCAPLIKGMHNLLAAVVLLLPLWYFSTRLSHFSLLSCFIFSCNVTVHLTNVNATGKKRPGCKEGHRWNGGARDQVWRHGLLHHARGYRTLAVLPGARCQIITLGAAEEKGELPLLCAIKQQAKVKKRRC